MWWLRSLKNMFEEGRGPDCEALNPNLILIWSAPCATARPPTAPSPAGTASALAVSRSGTTGVPNPLALCAVSPSTLRGFTG